MTFREFLENKRYVYSAIGVLIAIVGGIGLWITNGYTIAVVNGTSIPVNEFSKNVRAASVYYGRVQESYDTAKKPAPGLNEKDIKAAVLTQLVESVIIGEAAKREVGDELDALVEERIAKYRDDESLATASKNLYGLSKADFMKEVLVPQAKQDIVRGRLFLKGVSFDPWLKQAKKDAIVHIFSKEFTWNGETVAARD